MAAPKLRCEACDCRFDLDPYDANERRVRCPQCGGMVPIRTGSSRKSGGSGTKWVLIIIVLVGLLGLGCCGGFGLLFWYSVKPTDFPEQTQDYSDARKAHKTQLLRQGPSQQAWKPETPPVGVNEVTYKSGELQLKAWVNRPAAIGNKKPAVLFLHGGFSFDQKDWDHCQPFRDAGFVTMTPMLRGENGLPGNYTFFYDEVDDIVAAAETLALLPGVDPNRIFVAGHSAGGTLAMLGAMTSKRFKGCASFSGSPDQVAFVRAEPGLAPFDVNNFKELEMRSPLAYPKSFKCPARLYWGDEEFPLQFSTQKLAKKAKAAGLDVQAIEVPGDHTTSVDPAMRLAATFFQQVK